MEAPAAYVFTLHFNYGNRSYDDTAVKTTCFVETETAGYIVHHKSLFAVLTQLGGLSPLHTPLLVTRVIASRNIDTNKTVVTDTSFNEQLPGKRGATAVPLEGTYNLEWRKQHTMTLDVDYDNGKLEATLRIRAPNSNAARAVFADIMTEVTAHEIINATKSLDCIETTIVRTDDDDVRWMRGPSRVKRDLSTLYLPSNIKANLIKELSQFEADRADYITYGVPHKKVILLAGPPGTGKTSLVWAAASHLNKNVALLTASSKMTNEHVGKLLRDLPCSSSFLLIEEIDCLFRGREGTTEAGQVTFSQLLTMLDGLNTPEGVVIFLTTNHRDRLTDAAFNRAQRIDHEYTFPYMAEAEVAAALQVLAKSTTDKQRAAFLDVTRPLQYTMSTLQEYLFRRRNEPERLLNDIGEFTALVSKYHAGAQVTPSFPAPTSVIAQWSEWAEVPCPQNGGLSWVVASSD